MSNKKKRGLGRGLGALLQDHKVDAVDASSEGEIVQEVALELIEANPFQPRKIFTEEELDELASTIEKHGLLQPIVVRKHESKYQIVAGERRFRAFGKLGKSKIPARVHERLTDKKMMELAIIENIQRVELSSVEEAVSFEQLINEHGYTHEDLADVLGKSRSTITNTLRLMKLPPEVQQWIAEGSLSAGHARNLLRPEIVDPVATAQMIMEQGLSVREAEKIHLQNANQVPKAAKAIAEVDPNVVQFENDLRYALATDVKLNVSKNKGKIEVSFSSLDELSRIKELIVLGASQVQ